MTYFPLTRLAVVVVVVVVVVHNVDPHSAVKPIHFRSSRVARILVEELKRVSRVSKIPLLCRLAKISLLRLRAVVSRQWQGRQRLEVFSVKNE